MNATDITRIPVFATDVQLHDRLHLGDDLMTVLAINAMTDAVVYTVHSPRQGRRTHVVAPNDLLGRTARA